MRTYLKCSRRKDYYNYIENIQCGIGENVYFFEFFRISNNKKSNKSINNSFECIGVNYTKKNASQAFWDYFAYVYRPGYEIKISEVEETLRKLKPKKPAGSDMIPPYI